MGSTRTSKISLKIIKPLQPFLKKIVLKFNPEKIILFGSRARGEAYKSSDYDLLLVSSEFTPYGMYERMIRIYQLQQIPLAIDLLCLTPLEFNGRKKEHGIVQEAVREGIDITGMIT